MLMMSLLAMSVTVASADIARPPCHFQIRADNMCHAASLPGSTAEPVKKPGVCFLCLAPACGADGLVPQQSRLHAAFGAVHLSDARWTSPWRPPRA